MLYRPSEAKRVPAQTYRPSVEAITTELESIKSLVEGHGWTALALYVLRRIHAAEVKARRDAYEECAGICAIVSLEGGCQKAALMCRDAIRAPEKANA